MSMKENVGNWTKKRRLSVRTAVLKKKAGLKLELDDLKVKDKRSNREKCLVSNINHMELLIRILDMDDPAWLKQNNFILEEFISTNEC